MEDIIFRFSIDSHRRVGYKRPTIGKQKLAFIIRNDRP